MIFNKDIVYIHYPKTAGMMLTKQLLIKLKGRVYYSLPKGHASPFEKSLSIIGKIKILSGLRHENLQQAENITIKNLGRKLNSFEKIILVIRNPYDYEVSLYHYLKTNLVHQGPFAKAAREYEFGDYLSCTNVQFPINDFLEFNESLPLSIIKYENLEVLNQELGLHLYAPLNFKNKVNASVRNSYTDYLKDEKIEALIYSRNQFLFENGFYQRHDNYV